MEPDCFICGATIVVKRVSKKRRELNEHLPNLVKLLCQLLELTEGIGGDDWEGTGGQAVKCCIKCYELFVNVEQLHQVIVESQTQLKSYLDQVEKLIVESEESASWKFTEVDRSYLEFRRGVLKKANFTNNCVKEELSDPLALSGDENYEDLHDNFNLDDFGDVIHNETETGDTTNVEKEEPSKIPVKLEPAPNNIPSVQLPKLLASPSPPRTTPSKKRKAPTTPPPPSEAQLPSEIKRSRPSRTAKDNAQKALQKCSFNDAEGEEDSNSRGFGGGDTGEEDDAKYNSNNDQGDSQDSDENEETGEVEEATSQSLAIKTGDKADVENTKHKRFVVVQEDLLIYRMETFVRKTPTHLQCLAYKCTFQTPFEFYFSFKRMREHQEAQHRSQKFRRRTPHPCVPCQKLFKNREDLALHLGKDHNGFNKTPDTLLNRNWMCESCTQPVCQSAFLDHVFEHKNAAEKDAEPFKRDRKSSIKRRKKPIPKDKQQQHIWPFLVCDDDLLLYRFETFVRRTPTHLQCLAYKCTYQTEFDYYPSFQRMREHQETTHRDRKYRQQTAHPCVPCNQLFKNREPLVSHIRTVHKNFILDSDNSNLAICECCTRYLSSARVKIHIYNHKNDQEKAACSPAEIPKYYQRVLNRDPNTRRIYRCRHPGCEKTFQTDSGERRHYYSHLPRELRKGFTVCEECGKDVVNDKLPLHRMKYHGTGEGVPCIECQFCQKRYLRKDRRAFEAHLLKHKGVRPFMCAQCGQGFYTNGNLKAHVRETHEEREPDPVTCEHCGQVFLKKGTLTVHVKRKHREIYEKKVRKLSSFYAEQRSKVEGVVYGPVQMYPCTAPGCEVICGYRCTLKKHMMNIHGIGGFKKREKLEEVLEKWRKEKGGKEEESEEEGGDEEEKVSFQ